ncbi:hypothetical protein NECAME_09513 [Necator americanus]|uniref:Uncharacterized protein n=1 Tax=Necator americanus TaxID=51031 RepID=W2TDK4_NECAM|nr:hypothetical protein NECAME_09513 [Necator americanus]ETN79903.1 hypothetical protein NECAME_09513 [Necator americanus]
MPFRDHREYVVGVFKWVNSTGQMVQKFYEDADTTMTGEPRRKGENRLGDSPGEYRGWATADHPSSRIFWRVTEDTRRRGAD